MNPRPFKEHELRLGNEPEKDHVGMSTADDDASQDIESAKKALRKKEARE